MINGRLVELREVCDGKRHGRERGRKLVLRVERLAERIAQRCVGDVYRVPRLNLALLHRRQVYPNREHVGVGGHARCPNGLGALQVGFGRSHGFLGDP